MIITAADRSIVIGIAGGMVTAGATIVVIVIVIVIVIVASITGATATKTGVRGRTCNSRRTAAGFHPVE